MKNIEILNKKLCTGCFACVQKCPKKCIKLVKSKDGYFYPSVDNGLCVECGLCAQACPQLSEKSNHHDGMISYAVQCDDSIRLKCSSGGVFYAIAKAFVSFGGFVCGAAFTDDFTSVQHIIVNNEDDLEKLLGSKYVQSSTENVFIEVEDLLKGGQKVLFCGCPCQVDGLLHYLGKEYKNLYTIDILCHGVPSPEVYKSHLEKNNKNRDKITNVSFRKTDGWGIQFKIDFEKEKPYIEPSDGLYVSSFLSGYNMREACYHCKYANKNRVSDLTIGDYWGADKDLIDGKGLSIAFVNSVKGAELLNLIKNNCSKFINTPLSHALEIAKKTNGALYNPTLRPEGRNIFFSHYKTLGIGGALSYAKKELMDVGILGWWIYGPNSNYGSTLTAYALDRYLTSLGLSTAFVSPPNFDRNTAGSFNKKYKYRMTAKYSPEDMWNNCKYISSFIVGSDVLWYYDSMISSAGYAFMLNFVGEDRRKISYSTSFGNPKYCFPTNAVPYAANLLKKFDFISTRELMGVKILKDKFGVQGTQVMDPVFLCPQKDWDILANNAVKRTDGDFVFAYFLDPNEDKIKCLKKVAEHYKCPIVSITDRQYGKEKKIEMLSDCGIVNDMSTEEFIYHTMHAKCIITDSFHGTCFSIIFRKNFFAVPNANRDTTRFDTLSELLGVGNRMIINADEFLSKTDVCDTDYSSIADKVEFHTKRSVDWLNNALFSDIENKNLVIDKDYVK